MRAFADVHGIGTLRSIVILVKVLFSRILTKVLMSLYLARFLRNYLSRTTLELSVNRKILLLDSGCTLLVHTLDTVPILKDQNLLQNVLIIFFIY